MITLNICLQETKGSMALHLHLMGFVLLCFLNYTHGKKTKDQCQNEINQIKENTNDDEFLEFFRGCVAEFYDFESEDDKAWKTVPTLGDVLNDVHFDKTAKAIEIFFKKKDNGKVRNWESIKAAMMEAKDGKNEPNANEDKSVTQCKNMLQVIAARQVYVTYILKKAAKKAFNNDDFKLCEKEGNMFIIPEYACYPPNSGSKRCTSDYDVSLLGPHAGSIVPIYNKHFKTTFGMTSDALFDNNLYAFSLEFAVPELFELGKNPGENAKEYFNYLKEYEKNTKKVPNYQSQNIALAYTKVHVFEPKEEEFYETQMKQCLHRKLYEMSLNSWFKKLDEIKKKDLQNMPEDEKAREYERLISEAKEPWNKKYTARLKLSISEMFASESYFSKGAIRVVVGSQQMKNELVTNGLKVVDHWCSFIENFGDVLKEHGRSCKANTDDYKCLLKLSKYLFRTFTSIEVLLGTKMKKEAENKLEENKNKFDKVNMDIVEKENLCIANKAEDDAIKRFQKKSNPSAVDITSSWITLFKDKGKQKIDEKYAIQSSGGNAEKDWVKIFLTEILGCTTPMNTADCLSKLKSLVRGVNRRLLLYADSDGTNLGKTIKEIQGN